MNKIRTYILISGQVGQHMHDDFENSGPRDYAYIDYYISRHAQETEGLRLRSGLYSTIKSSVDVAWEQL